ncbi:unnamed protein product [Candida verbasci]|uniref:UBC core domain-containing protein n=1 Tax=Candida verbasci TaxID=1227364 RepID=A0A9W4TY58_9ASCO|nr:unnamed protein product [Candida verbasci]
MAKPHPFHKRLIKEYTSIQKNKLPGIKLIYNDDQLINYIFQIIILNNEEIYKPDVKYYLSIIITNEYPVDSPQVKFISYSEDENTELSDIPLHPHIYSNGHICLNLLGEDWTPACSIESILLSIQSMLNNNQLLTRPPDNDSYIKHAPLNPKQSKFIYHDDNV